MFRFEKSLTECSIHCLCVCLFLFCLNFSRLLLLSRHKNGINSISILIPFFCKQSTIRERISLDTGIATVMKSVSFPQTACYVYFKFSFLFWQNFEINLLEISNDIKCYRFFSSMINLKF